MNGHDFERQRAETLDVFRDIAGRASVPERIRLELQFVPLANSDWTGVRAGLTRAGFAVDRYGAPGSETLEAAIELQGPSGEAIWRAEERATRVCLAHSFRPDGWGFRA